MTRTPRKPGPAAGANQDRAGSPFTQVRVREVYSMTDVVEVGTEWVPRVGIEPEWMAAFTARSLAARKVAEAARAKTLAKVRPDGASAENVR